MVSKRRQKAPTTAPKTKLKTMNDISAAAAVKLFHAAMLFDYECPEESGTVIPEGFPQDITAKDFMDSLAVYRQWWVGSNYDSGVDLVPDSYYIGADGIPVYDEGPKQPNKDATAISEEDLSKLSPEERKIVDLIIENPGIRRKEAAAKLGKNEDTLRNQWATARIKLGLSRPNHRATPGKPAKLP